jgi:phage shock protein PspC (stress-responsive transcriptional regulator)
MKKTITINISGYAFNIEEEAFEILSRYLSDIRQRISNQSEVDETLNDIEYRIAELFRASCPTTAQIVTVAMVQEVMGIMGSPSDFGDDSTENTANNGNASNEKSSTDTSGAMPNIPPAKRLYRDVFNRMIAGVCSGLAAYFAVDVVIVRVLFVVLALTGGVSFLAYLALWIAMPAATSMAQRNQMMGGARYSGRTNDQSGFSTAHQSYASSGSHTVINQLGRGIAALVGAVLTLVGITLLSVLSMLVFWSHLFPKSPNNPLSELLQWAAMYIGPNDFWLFQLAIAALIGIPLLMLVYGGIRLMFDVRRGSKAVGIIAFLIWVCGLLFVVYISIRTVSSYDNKELPTQSISIKVGKSHKLYLEPMASDTVRRLGDESDDLGDMRISFNNRCIYARKRPVLYIVKGDSCTISLKQHLYFPEFMEAHIQPIDLSDLVVQRDSVIQIKSYFELFKKSGNVARTIEYTLQVPAGYSLDVNPLLKKFMKVE